jgi:hypothetical protein
MSICFHISEFCSKMKVIEYSAKVLSPLLEERARERGGCQNPCLHLLPNPTLPLKGRE